MFGQVRIQGLGPLHDRTFDMDPAGRMEIAGPSESGKSTLVEAVCFALWGVAGDGRPFPVEALREEAQAATVTCVTARGTVLRRRLTRSRQQSRELDPGSGLQVFTREEELAAKLGAIGQKPELGRLVLVPFAWVPLLQRELGRPLRDMLLSALPGGDLRAEISRLMGEHALRDSDPLDAAGAAKIQTVANRSRDEAKGRLQAAEARRSSAAPVAGPSAEDEARAQGTVQAAEIWRKHDEVMRRWEEQDALRAQAVQRRDGWRRRFQELGECPQHDAQALRAAQETVKRLDRELSEERRAQQADLSAERDAAGDLGRARARYAELRQAGDTCPTCERPGWAQASERLASASAEGKRLAEAHEGRKRALEVRGVRVQDLERETSEAHKALAKLEAAAAAPRAWEDRRRALGPEPQTQVPQKQPKPPEGDRPGQDQIERAQRTIRTAAEAAGAAKRAEQEAAQAARELAGAKEALERASAEASRIEALVAACRQAPSEIARGRVEALGDLGPVQIAFPERLTKQTPEIEVLVDGRPYWLASTGRQVVADLYLRAAIRRIAGLAALPIAVDRAQDWSGEWPEVPGPIWFLRTRPGELTVRRLP